ncbi:MAG: glutamate-5-semialdehyde dehydrogenase [Clostridiales bacterium]|nr:glutamate-5-semialdehyde dehydrogenase [Clostridiales bacterium]
MDFKGFAGKAKESSFKMASIPCSVRDYALLEIMKSLDESSGRIFRANSEDLDRAKAGNLPGPVVNRLKFDSNKLKEVSAGISDLTKMPDPLFNIVFERELDKGLTLCKTTCPIGVVCVIFESRPDALIQISALCVKSGNSCILKGGSEAANTNRALFDVIYNAGTRAGLPEGFASLAENRADVDGLLKCHESIDLVIPRGSNSFVQHIMENSKIPVMGHADGICHIYADKSADVEKAVAVIEDAKIQYVAVCNAVETLLVHKDAAAPLLPALKARFDLKGVVLRGCPRTKEIIDCESATDEDYRTEYLDYVLSVKIVDSLAAAVSHINKYGSHHTDCIMTEDREAAEEFMAAVDSAGVYQNCSTRFADGYRYGFGAEVGVSTGKLHARGPVGLDGLVSYKYKLYGDGHIVADYSEGRKSFNFTQAL